MRKAVRMATDTSWDQRLAELWASADSRSDTDLVGAMDALTAELPAGDGVGPFERAAARDSTGHSDLALPLHRQALDLGLPASAGVAR